MASELREPLRPELSRTPGAIHLLSINMFLRPPLIHNNTGDLKDVRTLYFCKHILPLYDIVCLQEMFGTFNSRKTQMIQAGKDAGLTYWAESPAPSFWSSYLIDGGLLILSRFPILESEFRPYGSGIFPDSLSQKGALYCLINVEGARLHLFTTHTQSFYVTTDPDLHRLYRSVTRHQIQKLANFMLEKQGLEGLMLLAGDLNVDALEAGKEVQFRGEIEEYEALMLILKTLEPREVLKEIYETHPVTHGKRRDDGTPDETVLTHQDDQGKECALDYLFTVNESTSDLNIDIQSTKVEAFYIKDQPFTQISDHLGIHTVLRKKGNRSS